MMTGAENRPTSRSEQRSAHRSFNSEGSTDSQYPGGGDVVDGDDHNPLLSSIHSQGSLWKQYSLINNSFQQKGKSQRQDLCFCCEGDSLRHSTLKVLFLFIVGFGLVCSCLALRFSIFSPKSVLLTGGDQSLLPTSTYFNKEITVKEECELGIERSMLYVLPGIPRISSERLVYSEGTKLLMPSWSYQYWGLNLLKGSEVTISICADLHLQFYILKGEKKLKAWKETILFNDYDFQSNIRPKKSCEAKGDMKSHSMKIGESDVFYILFSSSVGWRFFTEVNIILHFNRTFYDTTASRESCLLSDNACTGRLRYASDDIALVQTAVNISHPASSFKTFKITFDPVPRWSFYMKLFGLVYAIVVAATILYSMWRLCVVIRRRKSGLVSAKEEKQPLLQDSMTSRPYSYSLQSTTRHARDPWVVINYEPTNDEQEHDDDSLLNGYSPDTDNMMAERRPSLQRRYTTVSNFSNESEHSLYMNRRGVEANEAMLRTMQNLEQQQLLDSVMTAAGVSAI